MSDELPPLRCESRRPRPPDGGAFKWILALVVIGASTLDALWLIPAQRDAERRQREEARRIQAQRVLVQARCGQPRVTPPPREPAPRATRANDILLLSPSQLR